MKIKEEILKDVLQNPKLTTAEYMAKYNVTENYGRMYMSLKDSEAEVTKAMSPRAKTIGGKKYLVMGCVHVPFNNKYLMDGVIAMMQTESFDGIILAGDFLDMGALSSYDKGRINNSGITLVDEYKAGNELLDTFDKYLPEGALKVFMFGNHEDRYFRWLSDVNNSKYGDLINPIDQLRLKERGYEVYSDYANDIYNLGSLQVMHGDFYNIHCAKKHLDVFRHDILFFHTHRVQTHREGNLCAYNAGCLIDKTSPAFNYAKRGMKSVWANAFAIVTLEGDDNFVNIVNCRNDRFEFNNKIYGKIKNS